MKIPAPNFTQTPNALFDEWLPKLKEVELKCLLIIMRKTFGWHKQRDRISLKQLETLTGSDKKNVWAATESLKKMGLITKTVEGPIGKQVTYYELVVEDDSNNSYPRQFDTPPGGNLPPTKETLPKETVRTSVQNCVPQKQQATMKSNDEMPRAMRPIPHFLKSLKCFKEPDKQKLANAFSDQVLSLSLEDCRSWAVKNGIPDNSIAFMWTCCKKNEKKYGSLKL